jgi:hypothetical protein
MLFAILCTLDHKDRIDDLICGCYVQQHWLLLSGGD